jgi:hypothetical protein
VLTSKKLRKHHRSLDQRSSESIIEIQIIEAQQVLQKFRSKKLRKNNRSSDHRSPESITEVQIIEALEVS